MRDRLVSRWGRASSAPESGASAQPHLGRQEVQVGECFAGTRLRVLAELGQGGMGKVYRAFHEELGLEVALKVIHSHLRASPRSVNRMRNEWRSLARLRHPNVVRVLDAGFTPKSTPYLVMEWVDGAPLDRVLKAGRLPTRRALELYLELLSALAALHRIPILHRDIKPQNLILSADGALKLLDFGVAQVAFGEGARLTRAGATVGTPGYMAPEQAEGRALDARADIYASSLVLYEMLTGAHPFSHHLRRLSLIDAHLHEEPRRLEARVPSLPPELGDLMQRCLAKDPASRPPSAAAVSREIQALLHSLPVAVAPDGMPASQRTTQVECASAPGFEARTRERVDLPYAEPARVRLKATDQPLRLRDGGVRPELWEGAAQAEIAPPESAAPARVRKMDSPPRSRALPAIRDRGSLRAWCGWLSVVAVAFGFSFSLAHREPKAPRMDRDTKQDRGSSNAHEGSGGSGSKQRSDFGTNQDIIQLPEGASTLSEVHLRTESAPSPALLLERGSPLAFSGRAASAASLLDHRFGPSLAGDAGARARHVGQAEPRAPTGEAPSDPLKLDELVRPEPEAEFRAWTGSATPVPVPPRRLPDSGL